jgi:aspartyl-tRNA(Asn)/glutamyl-tRNA(Gln) amidotransferase subunit A
VVAPADTASARPRQGQAMPVRLTLSALAEGSTTATALTRQALMTAEACKADLNAFSVIAHKSALAAAADSDRRYAAGNPRLLEGLPVAIKDMIDTKGIETRYGSAAYLGHVPSADADVVRRLVDDGAIIVGKTTTHEFAWGVTTASPAFGDTLNPHNRAHIPGGSSGGAAAAVAYGAVAAGLGTDTGGSVRIPAALCGVVGFKPTLGTLPTAGIFPLAQTLDHPGLIGSCVDDIIILAGAFGIEARSDTQAPSTLGVIREIPPVPLDSDVATAFDRATDKLSAAFLMKSRAADSLFDGVFAAFAGIVLTEGGVVHFGQSDATTIADHYNPETVERLERARTVTLGDYARFQNTRRQFRATLSDAMSTTDYLIIPTCPCVAPGIGETTVTLGSWSGSVREALMTYTAPFNVAGYPAISIPLNIGSARLPCALQVVARPGNDGGLLSLARKVEGIIGAGGPPERRRARGVMGK